MPWLALLLVAWTLLAFEGTRHNAYLGFDDTYYVLENPQVRAGLSWEGLGWALRSRDASNWHPLTWLSHMLDVELFGVDPSGPHLLNAALHAAAALLFFGFLASTTNAPWRSAFAAAAFALHPLRVESVAWAAERKDVLAALFWMAALCGWARFARSRSRRAYAGTLLCAALALLAKPTAVSLPFALLLVDRWPLARCVAWRRRLAEKAPFFVVAGAASLAALWAQGGAGSIHDFAQTSLAARLLQVPVAYASYLGSTLWPVELAPLYPARSPSLLAGASAMLLLAALSIGAFAARRRSPALWIGWLWFLVVLAPMSGIVAFGYHSHADRYTYLPHAGLFAAAAFGWPASWLARAQLRGALALLALGLLAGWTLQTRAQVARWRDTSTLFEYTVAVTGENAFAEAILAEVWRHRGESERALAHYARSIEIDPNVPRTRYTYGTLLLGQHRFEEAIPQLRASARLQPEHAKSHFNLAVALEQTGQQRAAIEAFRAGLAQQPDDAAARLFLARGLLHLGERAAAATELRELLRRDPDNALAQEGLARLVASPPPE